MKALHYISELPPYALWSLGTGFVGWIIGPWLGFRYAQMSKRLGSLREFRDTINDIASMLAAHRNTGLPKAYEDTRPIVRSKCAHILEDIRWWRSGRFKRAAEGYLSLTQKQTDPNADPKHMTDAFTVEQRRQRFDAARALMIERLSEIVKYAH